MILPGTLVVDLALSIEPEEYEMEVVEPEAYDLVVEDNSVEFSMSMDFEYHAEQVDGETYMGAYSVDPSFDSQVLETERKFLTDDIAVNPIMVSRVSNLQGGTTVYIGGEFYA